MVQYGIRTRASAHLLYSSYKMTAWLFFTQQSCTFLFSVPTIYCVGG